MRVAKIDDRQAWMIEIGSDRILINPRQLDSEMLRTGQWSMAQDATPSDAGLPKVHLVLISSDSPDHYNPEVLDELGKQMPIFTTPRVAKKLNKRGFKQVKSYADKQTIKSRNTQISGFPIQTVSSKQAAAFFVRETARKATAFIVPFGAKDYPIPVIKQPVDFFLAPTCDVKRLGITIAGSHALAIEAATKLKPRAFAPIGTAPNLPWLAKCVEHDELVTRGFKLAKLDTSILTPIPGKAVEIYRLEA